MSPTFLWEADEDLVAEPCPECGGRVRYYLTCHTWGGKADGTGWMSCLPCSTAYEFACARPDEDGDYLLPGCGWSYTWGLNPRNPRSAREEECAGPHGSTQGPGQTGCPNGALTSVRRETRRSTRP